MLGLGKTHSKRDRASPRGLDLLFHLHHIHSINEKECAFGIDFTLLVGWEFFANMQAFEAGLRTAQPQRRTRAEDLVYLSFSGRRAPWNCDGEHGDGGDPAAIQSLRHGKGEGGGEMGKQLKYEELVLLTLLWR